MWRACGLKSLFHTSLSHNLWVWSINNSLLHHKLFRIPLGHMFCGPSLRNPWASTNLHRTSDVLCLFLLLENRKTCYWFALLTLDCNGRDWRSSASKRRLPLKMLNARPCGTCSRREKIALDGKQIFKPESLSLAPLAVSRLLALYDARPNLSSWARIVSVGSHDGTFQSLMKPDHEDVQ